MGSANSIVLYVEDEESDRFLMQLAFQKLGMENALRMVNHGRAAIEYLSGSGVYGDRCEYPVPAVVLLDLNLPEVHGFEVLKWIREQPGYGGLPVVVFTSSAREEDSQRARLLGATDFLLKPGMPGGFQGVVLRLSEAWLGGKRSGGM